MKKIIHTLFISQIIFICISLWFTMQADKALPKDGIGDIEQWQKYNSIANNAIIIALILWVIKIVCIFWGKQHKLAYSKKLIVLPFLVFFIGWLLLWFI